MATLVDSGSLFGMARKARIHVPGGVYHVILRGNGEGRRSLYLRTVIISDLCQVLREGKDPRIDRGLSMIEVEPARALFPFGS